MDERPQEQTRMASDGPTQLATAASTQESINLNSTLPRSKDAITDSPEILFPSTMAKDERKTQSAPDAINKVSRAGPVGTPDVSSPAPQTRSGFNPPMPRRVSSKDKVRASTEFDRRYDGPFGRPSVTMTRRLSQPQSAALQEEVQLPPPAGGASVGLPMGAPDMPQARFFEPEPPALNYTLRTRLLSLVLWWTVIVFDSVVLPIGLYFGLWYGVGPGNPHDTRLSANTVFSIVTAAIGGASILEYFLRLWKLWKRNSTCRVLGAGRWYLDWFHWNFTFAWIVVMIELIVGSCREEPLIRLLSMPLATMLLVFGTQLLVIDIARFFQVPSPLRISSVPKGAQLRPGIYSLVEDICAVDGGGTSEFRKAFDRRYEASHVFRAMLRRLGIFWAVGAEACGVVVTGLVCGLQNTDIAYTIGWSMPFVWAGVWALLTWYFVDRSLKHEKKLWTAEAEKARV